MTPPPPPDDSTQAGYTNIRFCIVLHSKREILFHRQLPHSNVIQTTELMEGAHCDCVVSGVVSYSETRHDWYPLLPPVIINRSWATIPHLWLSSTGKIRIYSDSLVNGWKCLNALLIVNLNKICLNWKIKYLNFDLRLGIHTYKYGFVRGCRYSYSNHWQWFRISKSNILF